MLRQMIIQLEEQRSLIKANLVPLVNDKNYRGIIGSLLYSTVSRLHIVFSVGLYAWFQSCPNDSHLKTAKRIMRYLKGTMNLVLWYLARDSFDLVGFIDADYTGFLMERKSTSGMAYFLGPFLVSCATTHSPYPLLKRNMSQLPLDVLHSYG